MLIAITKRQLEEHVLLRLQILLYLVGGGLLTEFFVRRSFCIHFEFFYQYDLSLALFTRTRLLLLSIL